MSVQSTWYMKRLSQSKKNHWFRTWNRERRQEIINIWNITPNLHTNSHFEMWAEKWTIMQEASGSSTAPNAKHILACRLTGDKPSSEPMLKYYQLDPGNKFQWNLNQNTKKIIENDFKKWRLEKWWPFCLGLNVLRNRPLWHASRQ